jgi:peptidoglycan hydrolase-like protein with peptidoglycan-binding domain
MLKKWVILSILVIFAFSLTGCATARKQKDLEIQGLRNQISVLESQIQSKDEEINSLRETSAKSQEEATKQISRKKVIGEVKSRPNVKQIQIALVNAGYNAGSLDGRMGKQTRQAIKAFQRANNLAVDGKAGKQTWNLLKEYLYKKVK